MVCIYCSGTTSVKNSRPQIRLRQTWRRRACVKCGAVFTTIETTDLMTSLVVRRSDGSMAPFNRDRLLVSIMRAVGHREHPVDDAGALTATITSKLLSEAKTAAISTTDIVKRTSLTLKRFDKAAAVQYEAYHKT